MKAIALSECWGADTSAKLSAPEAKALAGATLSGSPVTFVERYVFFGRSRPGDLDRDEAARILDAGLTLLVVQHVRNPGWLAGGALGAQDGQYAASNAAAAGYDPSLRDEHGRGPSIALDLEGCKDSGQYVIDHCEAWASAVRAAGYSPVLYVGYDCGLTPEQLYEMHGIDRYWSDAGPRSVATRGFCCRQQPQTTAAGILVDPDYAAPDALGGVLTGVSA